MKGTFFNKSLEWNLETIGESWFQGSILQGKLKIKNHSNETIPIFKSGVALACADIKKVQSRSVGALKIEAQEGFSESEILPLSELSLDFSFSLTKNCIVSDKKTSYYLCFGNDFTESQLQIKVDPNPLYTKIISLFDTFQRFKIKEVKSSKLGAEFKLLPPTSRDMANIDCLLLTFLMTEDELTMRFDFHVKRLDTSSITTKINKDSVCIERSLSKKEFSLGRDMINQDHILKTIESAITEVKLKSVF